MICHSDGLPWTHPENSLTEKNNAMQLIITEKYSVAADVANATGAIRDGSGDFFFSAQYYITWLHGHVVEMTTEFDNRPWDMAELPVIPERFGLEPLHRRDAQGRRLPEYDSDCVHRLKVIKELAEKSSFVINAGDCAREGELIQRNVYSFIGLRNPVQRLWISSLTEEEIRSGLQNLKPGEDYDNLFASGRARAEADWLVGVNATRAFTLHSGAPMTLSLGRVQTPVLCMIARRYLSNRNFVPSPYWVLRGESTIKGFDETWRGTKQFLDEKEAQQAYDDVKAAGVLRVDESTRGERTTQAPLLHDINSLQKIANKRYGFTALETLSAAQALYEAKLISYPRTGSRHIPESLFKTVPDLLRKTAENYPDYADFIRPLVTEEDGLNHNCVNDAKVEDHYGLIVTGRKPSAPLSDTQQKVFDLVLTRSIEAFMPPCVSNVATINLSACNGKYLFVMNGSKIARAGWKAVCGKSVNEDDIDEEEREDGIEDGENIYPLPNVIDGQLVTFNEMGLKKLMTKPQAIYTDATLLSDMEHAGREVEDKADRDAIKDIGIGTPATRANELEILVRRGYIVRNSAKKILPTELGLSVYDAVKDRGIANVDITARWERQLDAIEHGLASADDFRKRIRTYTRTLTNDILTGPKAALTTYDCPKCKGKMKMNNSYLHCPDCKITIYRNINGKVLSSSQLGDLLTKGRTAEIRGFKTKEGKEFSSALALDENYKVVFRYVDHSVDKKGNQLVCPKCGKNVKVYDKSIRCSDEGCSWSVFRTVAGKTLTDSQVADLLTKRETGIIKGFKTKDGREFEAKVVMKDDLTLGFAFPQKATDSLKCPKCGGRVYVGEKTVSCRDREHCDWHIWRSYNGKELSEKNICDLLSVGSTSLIKGFVTKDGKTFDAKIILKADLTVGFSFKKD